MSTTESIQGTDHIWTFTLPDGVSLHQTVGATTTTSGGTFLLDGGKTAHGPLEIDVHLTPDVLFGGAAHGNEAIDITDNSKPGDAIDFTDVSNGLRGPIVVHFFNDLGIPLHKSTDGFPTLVLYDGAATDKFAAAALAAPNDFHTPYAHFHAGPSASFAAAFPGFDVTTQVGATGQDAGPPQSESSPDWININGDIPAGTEATWGPITFHLRDSPAADNGFLAFQTLAGAYDPAELAQAQAAYDAAHPTTPPAGGTTAVDWDTLATRVLNYFDATGQWGLLDDWLGNMPPDGQASGGPTDWDALAVRINAYHDATGQWGLLDQWLSSSPPDAPMI